MKPLHTLAFGDMKVTLYTGLLALLVNIVVVLVVNVLLPRTVRAPVAAAR